MGGALLSDVEMEFAAEVNAYNERVLRGQDTKSKSKSDLLASLASMVQQRLGDKNMDDAWSMLFFMANMPLDDKTSTGGDNSANDDGGTAHVNRDTSANQWRTARQGVAYLEYCFRELIQSTVNANLKMAKLGGALGTLALVSGYLRLPQSDRMHQMSEETYEEASSSTSNVAVARQEQQPLWPTVYLCLRCGDLEAARTVAMRAKKDDIAGYLDEMIRTSAANQVSDRQQQQQQQTTNKKTT